MTATPPDRTTQRRVGRRVRDRRRERGLSQWELARRVGISADTLSRLERGLDPLTAAKLAHLDKIAAELKTPIEWFYRED